MSGRSEVARAPNIESLHDAELRLRLAAGTIETSRKSCFDRTDEVRRLGPLVPRAMAKEAAAQWRTNRLAAPLDTGWVQSALVNLAQAEGEPVVQILHSATKELTEALLAADRALSPHRGEESTELVNLVNNMPIPNPEIPALILNRPWRLWRLLGLARWKTERRLRSSLGSQINDFFTSYGRLLELWVGSTLSNLEHEFEQRAEYDRAQLQRMMQAAGSPPADRASIEASLASLNKSGAVQEIPRTL